MEQLLQETEEVAIDVCEKSSFNYSSICHSDLTHYDVSMSVTTSSSSNLSSSLVESGPTRHPLPPRPAGFMPTNSTSLPPMPTFAWPPPQPSSLPTPTSSFSRFSVHLSVPARSPSNSAVQAKPSTSARFMSGNSRTSPQANGLPRDFVTNLQVPGQNSMASSNAERNRRLAPSGVRRAKMGGVNGPSVLASTSARSSLTLNSSSAARTSAVFTSFLVPIPRSTGEEQSPFYDGGDDIIIGTYRGAISSSSSRVNNNAPAVSHWRTSPLVLREDAKIKQG